MTGRQRGNPGYSQCARRTLATTSYVARTTSSSVATACCAFFIVSIIMVGLDGTAAVSSGKRDCAGVRPVISETEKMCGHSGA